MIDKSEIDNAIKKMKFQKNRQKIFYTPNSEDFYYGRDIKGACVPGIPGNDTFTCHVIQDTFWLDKVITYKWNSHGLRGPEPDYLKKNKIVFLGGSLCIGTGIPEENTFAHLISSNLDAAYINIGGADMLTDLIDPAKRFADFNPNYVILNDTRFIQFYSWALTDLKFRQVNQVQEYTNFFLQSDIDCLKLFEHYLKSIFPNATIILAACDRRAWRKILPKFDHMKTVSLTSDMVVDLARDTKHPGIKSHENFANAILEVIRPQ